MYTKSLTAAVAALLLLTGCGGDGGGASSGSGTAYNYVAPMLNSTRTYSETITDNSNNMISIGYSDAITTVNSDGSVSQLSQSTTGDSNIVNGTNYAIVTENQNFNAMGQETSYVYTDPSGAQVTCTFDPHGGGPDFPVMVGETWELIYTFACGTGATIAYAQSGSIVDVESITVPAGTYTAIKIQSMLTWTDAVGTTRMQTITNWRDVATLYSVKESISIAYSGTLPTVGYAVNREILLESMS